MLDEAKLANAILQASSQKTDKDGKPISVPSAMQEYASGIIAALKTGVVTFLPGTITGTAPPSGGPVINGAGSGGTALITPAAMVAKTLAAMPDAPAISANSTALIAYLTASSLVAFAAGKVTGTCGNTPSSPGPFIGSGTDGKITGLTGAACAAAVGAVGPDAIAVYDAITKYIMDNASVSIAVLTGTVSAGGGPLIAAGGTGGTIS